MTYLFISIAYFFYVFCRAFQQRNVAFNKYGWIMPFSFGMATIDVFVIASIASLGFKWGFVVAMAIGGGLGALVATYSHERWITNGREGNRYSRNLEDRILRRLRTENAEPNDSKLL